MLGVNAAGIKSKLTSFRNVLNELKPAVFFIEETKQKDEGKLKFENYDVFERVRENGKGGGGLALGCLKDLQAVYVRGGDEEVEALSVDIFVKDFKIRCVVAYGCQESDLENRKTAFWDYLGEEVSLAEQAEAGFILHMDGNLWAGDRIIPGDPRIQNKNGKRFQSFLEEHQNLTVVNSLSLCEGVITRSRNKDGKVEESVLDFFIVCNRVLPYVRKMKIDTNKEHVLTNYARLRLDGKITESDHFTQYMDLDLEIDSISTEKREILNFKNEQGQKKFKDLTSENEKFSDCFKTNAPLDIQIENWRDILRSTCYESFPKIRIRKTKKVKINKEISKLIKLRNRIARSNKKEHGCDECNFKIKSENNINNHIQKEHVKSRENHCNKCEVRIDISENVTEHIESIDEINKKISDIEAEEHRDQIVKTFKFFSDNPEKIQMSKMWKLLKKLWPKYNTQANAKQDHMGKIISNPKALKLLLMREYKERLRKRPMKEDMKHLKMTKEKILKMKMILASCNKTPEWTPKDLDNALAKLKNNKSRDFEGFCNEIFKENVIGTDLKKSLLLMFKKLKNHNQIPKFFNCANITTVPKKGSRLILTNERGIFRVSVIRSILMNLIYESNYPHVDKYISDCQMGGRQHKSCKNNIFIINEIIHDVMTSKNSKPVVLQYYDYSQMFDSIDLNEAINDIYDAGLNNDTLGLLYNSNSEVSMAIKTPHGITDRQTIRNLVLQGDKFGSLLASVQVDQMGQECMKAGYNFWYKDDLPVGFLGMVDDIVGVTRAGYKASQLNTFLNVKTSEKNLQFGAAKCQYMLVGKNPEKIIQNKLKVDQWMKEYKENATTMEYEMLEYYAGQTEMKQTEEYKYLGFVISCKGDNMAHIRNMKCKSIGVIKKICNKLESLNLKNYYFECSVILMNVILRGTILYAAELFYNLKENELRKIERIEEEFMRKILKTSKGCPITSLYLVLGQTPARFEILKMRLLFLKYILEQPFDSIISRMFKLQLENPTRGDWASTCLKDLENLNLKLTLEQIKSMKKEKYKSLVKENVNETALKYLINRQGKKGSETKYNYLEMAEYLLPFNKQSIEEKREMFAVKNSMVNIEANFSSKSEFKCECGDKEDMKHIYECRIYNYENPEK